MAHQSHKGRLALRYTSTSHKAQGATVDRALYVHDIGSEFVDRHMVYPSMTRGREENRVLVVGGDREEGLDSLAASMHRPSSTSMLQSINKPVTEEELVAASKRFPAADRAELEDLVREQRAAAANREIAEQQARKNERRTIQHDLAAERMKACRWRRSSARPLRPRSVLSERGLEYSSTVQACALAMRFAVVERQSSMCRLSSLKPCGGYGQGFEVR